jgi:hypothetical protein
VTLSCTCEDYGEWYYENQEQLPLTTKRSRKCCSCGSKIAVGDLSTKFRRYRQPDSDFEERFHGDEVPMTSWYMCEVCGDLFDSLKELGYCVHLTGDEDMKDLCRSLR